MSLDSRIANLHIKESKPLVSPAELRETAPVTEEAVQTILHGRQVMRKIIQGNDPRLLAIVGPCSVHNFESYVDYLERLAPLAMRLSERIVVVARAFFEKHRTGPGSWPGFLYDPHLNGFYNLNYGLLSCRRLLIKAGELGLPTAMEVIDPNLPDWFGELLTLAILGARSVEAQTERHVASGLSAIIGAKNATDGSISPAIEALRVAREPHIFPGTDDDGTTCAQLTTGNPDGVLILRGGRGSTNYDVVSILKAAEKLQILGLPDRVLVDCNHAQSGGEPTEQTRVCRQVVKDLDQTWPNVAGIMVESFLKEGKQPFHWKRGSLDRVDPELSITDPCIGWDNTEALLDETYDRLGRLDRFQ